jgi:hypothetical protein
VGALPLEPHLQLLSFFLVEKYYMLMVEIQPNMGACNKKDVYLLACMHHTLASRGPVPCAVFQNLICIDNVIFEDL